MTTPLKIAIASDLHCHSGASEKSESFLRAGVRRLPAQRHPIESLKKLIHEEHLSADLVICPGDLAHQVCEAGMAQAFSELQLLKHDLGAESLYCCLGNHDVASRGAPSVTDPFKLARELHEEFPVCDAIAKATLESSGYSIFNDRDRSTVLLINSVIDHRDAATARRGTFDDSRVRALEILLKEQQATFNEIRVAVMHHHPLVHSYSSFTSSDVLENGDAILNLLSQYEFRVLIHGHRHQPRLTYYSAPTGPTVVFAAGSFSKMLEELASVTRNMFHVMEIQNDRGKVHGAIHSWEFNFGVGWSKTSYKSGGFLPHQEFSSHSRSVTAEEIAEFAIKTRDAVIDCETIFQKIPDLRFRLPDEIRSLSERLQESHAMKFTFNELGELMALGKIVATS